LELRDLDNMILNLMIAILGIRKHCPNEHTDEFQQFRRRFQLPISLGGAGFMSIKEQGRRRSLDRLPSPPTTLRWWRLVFANLKFYPTKRPTANTQSTSRGSGQHLFHCDKRFSAPWRNRFHAFLKLSVQRFGSSDALGWSGSP
jgi:hypothetical protein